MGVDKVALRAFLSTLAAIGILLVFMIVTLCAVFPSTMMEMTYNVGMESASIHFAERAYKGSDDIYFIAYATEVSIEQDKDKKIISCGERFIEDERFDEYCSLKGENYQQFIYGQVCVATYNQGKKEEAVELAYSSLEGRFPKGNALVAVLIASQEQKDTATIQTIREKLNTLNVTGEEKTYLDQTLNVFAE